ncbi:MAG: response regulator [Planctomycetes bacterium]|jgi:CheY-like chemotaxis protein|nr:response regulator [Planctomycetota bacterium]
MTPLRILIVDDEATIRRACERILAEEGHSTGLVSRGEEALAALAEGGFDAVVLDLKMPGLGGQETLRKIRETWRDLPVVVITGYATTVTKRECVEGGAAVWLPKPFDPEQLLEALDRALGRRS